MGTNRDKLLYYGIFLLYGGSMDSTSQTGPLKENRHGTRDFPLAVYHSRPSLRQRVLYSHWHDEAEFFYLTHGQLDFRLDDRSFELGAGQAVFIGSGEVHAAYALNGSSCSFLAIVVSLDMLASDFLGGCGDSVWKPFLQGSIGLSERVFSRQTDWGCAVIDQIESIVEARNEAAPGYELAILSSLYSAFSGLIERGLMAALPPDTADRRSPRMPRLKTALRYIRDNAYSQISVEDIADKAHMSQYHFSRFFRQMTGCAPIEYVLRLRIDRAEKLLSETEIKIQEIAAAVGFRSAGHFIKTFKKHKQLTPAAFRKAARDEAP
jgi:AraC-like DNA-binding protein